MPIKRFVGPLLVAAIAVGAAVAQAGSPGVFAHEWVGHTRYLTITKNGHGREWIDSGCCDHVIDLTFTVKSASGTRTDGTATIRVLTVHVHDHSEFDKKHPAPHVGEIGRLRLRNHVLHESLTRTIYCDTVSGTKGTCGA
jgi:hypothetical protein